MGAKSSGNGASFANKASRDFVGTGSMTSRSPSFRMMASSPGNSNSRGIRTALFRPFLKTLTWRSGPVLAGFGGICQAYARGAFLSTVKSGTRHNLACSSGNKNRRTTPFKRCPAICRALRFNLTYDYLNVIMPKSPSLLLFGPAVKYRALVLPLIEEPPPNSMPQSWSILMGLPFEFVIVPTRAPVVGLNPLMVLVRLLSLPTSRVLLSGPKFFGAIAKPQGRFNGLP